MDWLSYLRRLLSFLLSCTTARAQRTCFTLNFAFLFSAFDFRFLSFVWRHATIRKWKKKKKNTWNRLRCQFINWKCSVDRINVENVHKQLQNDKNNNQSKWKSFCRRNWVQSNRENRQLNTQFFSSLFHSIRMTHFIPITSYFRQMLKHTQLTVDTLVNLYYTCSTSFHSQSFFRL